MSGRRASTRSRCATGSRGQRAEVRPEHAASAGRPAGAARREHGASRRVSGRVVPRAARGGRGLCRPRAARTSSSEQAPTTSSCSCARLPRGRGAGRDRAADVRALPHCDDAHGRRWSAVGRGARSSGSATRTTRPGRGRAGGESSSWRARDPEGDRRRRRGVRRVRGEVGRPVGRRAPEPRRAADAVEGVRLRGAPGRLRARAPETAALLEARRAPAPISGPSARIAAAALREPRFDVGATIAERERVRARSSRPGTTARRRRRTSSVVRTEERLGERLEEQGIVVRALPGGHPHHGAPSLGERHAPARARRRAGSAPGREATVHAHDDRDGAADHRSPSTARARARRDRHRLPRPSAHAVRVPRGLRPRAASRAATSTWTSTTRSRTCSPRSAARSAGARRAGRRRALRLGHRADGRGACHRGGRPRAAAARRDRARLHRRAGRGLAVSLLRTRSSASRSRPAAPCTSSRRAPTTTTSPRPPSRRSARRFGRPSPRAAAASARRRASREGGRSPTTAPGTFARSRRRSPRRRRARDHPRRGGGARGAARVDRGRRPRRERGGGLARHGLDRALRERAARVARRRHLRRHPAPVRGERGGRRAGSGCSPARSGGCGRVAFRTWAGTPSR